MKNKSKLKKIAQGKTKVSGVPAQWLYMNEQEITVCEIGAALKDNQEIEVEIWEDAKVLEIVIPEKKSVDMEQTKTDLRDEYSNAYLQEHRVKSLFFVSIDAEDYENVKHIMEQITKALGGFFCWDTENFEPVVK